LPDVGEAEIEAVTEAIRSGWVSSGPKVKEFEQAFSDHIGSDVVGVAVNSATAGLHLALEACGIGSGDEVLVPTWTFTATAEVVRYLGAEPVLVDVTPDELNMDWEDATRKLSSRTRAIMPVHFAGLPVSPKAIADFARSHELAVVEDAAHAFPASREGEPVGASDSSATVFSFYATKTMTTGEGGMVVTRKPDIAARIRTMRLHGISRDAFDRYRSSAPSWHYEVVAPGYKYNLTDPAAAMGLVQLRRAESMRRRRAEIATRYSEAFAALGLDLPASPTGGTEHSWHLYVIRVPGGVNRDRVIEDLAKTGIGTSVHFIPLHLQPYWRDRAGLTPQAFPIATREYQRVISLPIYSSMTDEQVDRVIAALTKVIR
jgi:dTDP-4-amino-4,6-dideoxygalactose transaminase